jgi:hypothetical protein
LTVFIRTFRSMISRPSSYSQCLTKSPCLSSMTLSGLAGAGWSASRRLCGREVSDRRSHLNAKLFDDSKKLPSSQREEGKAEGMPSAGVGESILEREARPFRQRQQSRRGVRTNLLACPRRRLSESHLTAAHDRASQVDKL